MRQAGEAKNSIRDPKKIAVVLGMAAVIVSVAIIGSRLGRNQPYTKGLSGTSAEESIPATQVLGGEAIDRLAAEKLGPIHQYVSQERLSEAQRMIAESRPYLEQVRHIRAIQESKGSEAALAALRAEPIRAER